MKMNRFHKNLFLNILIVCIGTLHIASAQDETQNLKPEDDFSQRTPLQEPSSTYELVGFCRLDLPEGVSIIGNPFTRKADDAVALEAFNHDKIIRLWTLRDGERKEYRKDSIRGVWVSVEDDLVLSQLSASEAFFVETNETISLYFLGGVRADSNRPVVIPSGESLVSLPWTVGINDSTYDDFSLQGSTDPALATHTLYVLTPEGYFGYFYDTSLKAWKSLNNPQEDIPTDLMQYGQGVLFKNEGNEMTLQIQRPY